MIGQRLQWRKPAIPVQCFINITVEAALEQKKPPALVPQLVMKV